MFHSQFVDNTCKTIILGITDEKENVPAAYCASSCHCFRLEIVCLHMLPKMNYLRQFILRET